MATNTPLPDGHRVNRGCSRGFVDGEITASAFDLRQAEKQLLRISAEWVECPHVQQSEQNASGSVKRMVDRGVRPPYVILSVTDVRQVERNGRGLNAKEFPTKGNPCHCSITGFTDTPLDLELQNDLAAIANQSEIFGS